MHSKFVYAFILAASIVFVGEGRRELQAQETSSSEVDENQVSQSPEASSAERQILLPFIVFDAATIRAQSLYYVALRARIEEESRNLSVENSQIEQALEAEELALVELKATLSEEAFAPHAQAFDQRVDIIREEQARKAQNIETALNKELSDIDLALDDVIADIVVETGALLVFEAAQIYAHSNAIDISSIVIARLNQSFANGVELGKN